MSCRRRTAIAILFVPATTMTAAAAPPNVLLIMADDLRPELGAFGSSALTPHLDRLAARGVRFERAFCQQALCNPSRSSMLTGRRPDTLRVWSNETHFRDRNPEVASLPGWFKKHGYEARCIGKIFHNWHTAVRVLDELGPGPFFLAVGFWKPHAPFNAPKAYWDRYDRDRLPPLDASWPAGAPEIGRHASTEILGPPRGPRPLEPEQIAEMRHGYFAAVSFMDA